MPLTLHVDRSAWSAHLDSVAAEHPGHVPVIKGNGYGFGRARLAQEVLARGGRRVAVGTLAETRDLPAGLDEVLLLTPELKLREAPAANVTFTVGSGAHIAALSDVGAAGARVVLKLASSMRRYGVGPDELPALAAAAAGAGLEVVGYSVHLPLAATSAANAAEVHAWLPHLDPQAELLISHLSAKDAAAVAAARPGPVHSRIGTRLWLGAPRTMSATATVLEVRAIGRGERFGYGQGKGRRGTLVMVSAGTAHGVALAAPRHAARGKGWAITLAEAGGEVAHRVVSPFTYQGARTTFAEPPHMHTSMLLVPHGEPVPDVGDELAVQVRYTTTSFDEIVFG